MLIGDCHGGLVSSRSFAELEAADLIVVGSAGSGHETGGVFNFALKISRVVKGNQALEEVTVEWNAGALAGPARELSGSGVWFLDRSPHGWTLLPVMTGDQPFGSTFIAAGTGPLPSAYNYSASAAVSYKIAAEVCSAVESATGPIQGSAAEMLRFPGALEGLNSGVVQRLFTRLANSQSTSKKMLGLSGLLRAGSAPALDPAIQAGNAFDSYPVESGILLGAIRNDFRASDAVSVSELGRCATSSKGPSLRLRVSCAHALAAIHTETALPYLAQLLDDPEEDLRVEGIGGMCSFANGFPIQTIAGVASGANYQFPQSAPFMTDDTKANFALGSLAIEQHEARYLSFWKAWWLQNRSALGY